MRGLSTVGGLTTPESIRTLQRKLYRKAKQEPACRFHALYDKVYRADILSHALSLVRANKGSAGIDGITFEAIEENEGATAFVVELAEALRTKCRQQRLGRERMPCSEEHRKAVCGKTACTV